MSGCPRARPRRLRVALRLKQGGFTARVPPSPAGGLRCRNPGAALGGERRPRRGARSTATTLPPGSRFPARRRARARSGGPSHSEVGQRGPDRMRGRPARDRPRWSRSAASFSRRTASVSKVRSIRVRAVDTSSRVRESTTLSIERHTSAKARISGTWSRAGSSASHPAISSYMRRPKGWVPMARSRSLMYAWTCSSGTAQSKQAVGVGDVAVEPANRHVDQLAPASAPVSAVRDVRRAGPGWPGRCRSRGRPRGGPGGSCR